MPYTNNPNQPKVRGDAAFFAMKQGVRTAARRYGVSPGTITKWVAKTRLYGFHPLPTLSSRPWHHPRELPEETVSRILELRAQRNQCAEILHHRLEKEGINVSLSSVKRVLRRHGISRYSRWKKWHQYPQRPLPEAPGALLELGSMQEGRPAEHLYAYALIDLHSRFAFAGAVARATSRASARFVVQAQKEATFRFLTLQTDHGGEFGKWFTKVVGHKGIRHRHSRVRRPTDNGHVERFIQTLQRECLSGVSRSLKAWGREIPEYLHYYNTQRPHMALGMKTPSEILKTFPRY